MVGPHVIEKLPSGSYCRGTSYELVSLPLARRLAVSESNSRCRGTANQAGDSAYTNINDRPLNPPHTSERKPTQTVLRARYAFDHLQYGYRTNDDIAAPEPEVASSGSQEQSYRHIPFSRRLAPTPPPTVNTGSPRPLAALRPFEPRPHTPKFPRGRAHPGRPGRCSGSGCCSTVTSLSESGRNSEVVCLVGVTGVELSEETIMRIIS